MNSLDVRLHSLDNYMHDISLQIAAYEYSLDEAKLNTIYGMCEELREYIDDYLLPISPDTIKDVNLNE